MAGPLVLAVTGPIGSGKTTLVKLLRLEHGGEVVQTRDLLRARLAPSNLFERTKLQAVAFELDEQTGSRWVADAAAAVIDDGHRLVFIDSPRTASQLCAIRALPATVHHIHLRASAKVLERRYYERTATIQEPDTYDDARADLSESKAEELADLAAIVVSSDVLTPEQIAASVGGLLLSLPKPQRN